MNPVTSPSSAARIEPPRPAPAASAGPRLDGPIPDVTLPLRFMALGVVSLVLGAITLVARPDLLASYHYNQQIVAVTHLFVLGFLLSVVSGAMYQLVPIVLETQLHSERLAKWHFVIHAVSVGGMVWMFWVWDMKQVGHFGSGLALGVGMFTWNLVRTLRRVRGWTPVSLGIASVLFWLGTTITAGLALSAAKSTYELVDRPGLNPMLGATLAGLQATQTLLSNFEPLAVMHAHAHLGVLGIFVLLTCTVAYRLIPMFVIGELQNPRRAQLSLWLLNLGVAACFLTVLTQSTLKPAAALVTIAGLLVYGLELNAIVRARRRRTLDWGVRAFLVSQSLLGLVAAFGLVLSWPGLTLTETVGRLETAYGFLAILGVVGLAILGMLYKIVPFLVWFSAYGKHIGRARTPALHEMYSALLQAWGCALWLAGLAGGTAGILAGHAGLVRTGAILLAASLLTLALNLGRILSHLLRPRLQPLVSGASQRTPTPPHAPTTRIQAV